MAKSGRDFLEFIRNNGLDEYGSVMPVQMVRTVLDLEFPETATEQEFNSLNLAELKAVDYVRNALLNEGKYIKRDNSAYRILLPSENHEQVMLYMSSAEKKLNRAIKLEKTTPAKSTRPNNSAVRAMMKLKVINDRVSA